MDTYLALALRASIMYLYTLLVLRLAGKRSIGHITPLDLLTATIIGDLFDDVFWAEVPILQGIAALGTVITLHTLLAYFSSHSEVVDHLTAGVERLLVRQGRIIPEALQKERLGKEEVSTWLRVQSEEQLQEIKAAYLEPSGGVSVIKYPDFKPAQKVDQNRLEEL